MSNIVYSTDESFYEEVLNSNIPVLVDFWAEWCSPCKKLSPILDEISAEYKDKLKVVKVNVDHNNNTAAKYGIKGIPTLLLIKSGEVVDTKVGSVSKNQLTTFIDTNI